MSRIDEAVSAHFAEWERRARGWNMFPYPIAPAPPFVPFSPPPPPSFPVDDGRRPTFLSSLVRSISRGLSTKPQLPDTSPDPEPEAEELPPVLEREELTELPLFLPPSFNPRGAELAQLMESLSACSEPIAFEVVGTPASVMAQLAVAPADAPHVSSQLLAFFPDLACAPASGILASVWENSDEWAVVAEFGLAREPMLPLAAFGGDLCVPLVGALAELSPGECGVFQVIFQPTTHPWAEHMAYAVGERTGMPFVNAPELAGGLRQKTSRPLYGAVVRIATRADSDERAWDIAKGMASALRVFANIGGNELIPLRNDDYPFDAHVADVPRRQSRRAGMLLNSDELLGLIRFPGSAVRTAKFLRQVRKTKLAPKSACDPDGILVGLNEHAGKTCEVRLTPEQRTRHVHLIGASGTGKSTLLLNLIRQDIEDGQGVAVLDPHGDLIDKILGAIPAERVKDVVLLDPADENFVVGFNVLVAHSDWEKNLLASDLVAIFRRLSTSWGDQMNSVLGKAILAFLESERGGTLADLRRFLLEPAYRNEFLDTVRDPEVTYYWRKAFPQLAGNKSVGPIVTRLETFLAPKTVRYMVSQERNRLDFSRMMDEGKIFLGRLSKGVIGDDNAHLLGSLLVSKFQQAAMARQRQDARERRDFWLYADECAEFLTPSMGEILSGTRKYRLGLTLAHHDLHQLQKMPDVASAVMTNCHARIVFRVGDQDARALERDFSAFEARDLQNLGAGQAVARFERSDCDFNLTIPQFEQPGEAEASARRAEVKAASHARYATPRAEVEAAAFARAQAEAEPKPAAPAKAKAKRDEPPPSEEPPLAAPAVNPAPSPSMPAVPASPTPATNAAPEATPPPEPPTSKPDMPSVNQALAVNPQKPVNPVTPSASSKPATGPAEDAGRGGYEHKAIQKRIREAAQALGFRCEIEKQLPLGSADVSLVRADIKIGCEVTVSNTIDYEAHNVAKCVTAGFEVVAIISRSAKKREQIREAAMSSLGAEVGQRIRCFAPDEFIGFLRSLPPPPCPKAQDPQVQEIKGWKVTTTGPQELSPVEQKAREEAGLNALAEAIKKKPKPSK